MDIMLILCLGWVEGLPFACERAMRSTAKLGSVSSFGSSLSRSYVGWLAPRRCSRLRADANCPERTWSKPCAEHCRAGGIEGNRCSA